jgi:hypothetical protein
MAKFVVIEELHVTVRVLADLPDDRADVLRAGLTSKPFRSRLLAAVKQVVAGFPALAGVRVHISR